MANPDPPHKIRDRKPPRHRYVDPQIPTPRINSHNIARFSIPNSMNAMPNPISHVFVTGRRTRFEILSVTVMYVYSSAHHRLFTLLRIDRVNRHTIPPPRSAGLEFSILSK